MLFLFWLILIIHDLVQVDLLKVTIPQDIVDMVLDNRQIEYIHPKVLMESFEIDFNLVNGETKLTIVNLTGNFNLSLLSKSTCFVSIKLQKQKYH